MHLHVKLHLLMCRRATKLVPAICPLPESPFGFFPQLVTHKHPENSYLWTKILRQWEKFQTIYTKYFCLLIFSPFFSNLYRGSEKVSGGKNKRKRGYRARHNSVLQLEHSPPNSIPHMPCVLRWPIQPQNRSLADTTEAAVLVPTLMHLCLQAVPWEILLAPSLGPVVLLDSFMQRNKIQ